MLAGAGPGMKLQSNGVDQFGERAGVASYNTVPYYNPCAALYVRADVTLGSSRHSANYAQTLVLWGSTDDGGAGGWRAWITSSSIGVDVQSGGGGQSVSYSLTPGARYELEFYFDIARQKTEIWVNGVKLTLSGGLSVAHYPSQGYVTVGYSGHGGQGPAFLQGSGGAIHSFELYDCTAPPEPFTNKADLQAAVNSCLDWTGGTGSLPFSGTSTPYLHGRHAGLRGCSRMVKGSGWEHVQRLSGFKRARVSCRRSSSAIV